MMRKILGKLLTPFSLTQGASSDKFLKILDLGN